MQSKDKVRFYKTPDALLQKQLEAYDAAAGRKAAENPLFKEIEMSQRNFAARAVKWDLDTNVARRMAYNHYFAKTSSSADKPAAPASKPAAKS
jgi:TRAP-type mannitol/chloroaromatic compound transport system substrate-binding protein